MGHSKGSVKGIMKLLPLPLSSQLPSVAVIFVMMELAQSALMVPRPSTTDQQERILMDPSTSHPQFAMERELLPVLTGQPQKFALTLAVTMRRNAQPVRVREQWTSLLLHVLMAQSVSVQEEERIANSTTESAAMDKDAERCVARDNLTALGGRRTGTSTTVSGSSILEILDLATRDTTGDPTLLETRLEDIIMLSFRIRLWYLLANVSCQRARNIIGK